MTDVRLPRRARLDGRGAGPRRRPVGRADAARGRELPDLGPAGRRRALIRALALIKARGGPGQRGSPTCRRRPADRRRDRGRGRRGRRAARTTTQFPIDAFQTGSGTSSNMNANEVIARLASARLGEPRGAPERPRERVAVVERRVPVGGAPRGRASAIADELDPGGARSSRSALRKKQREFAHVVKAGRTHLMDATPVTLGQEFGGYAAQVEDGIARLDDTLPRLCVLPLGGTAVGTGINAPKGFARKVIARLADAHRAAAHRGEGPLRRAGRARRARRDERPAAHARGVAGQDRERPALDGERAAHRPGRDPPARPAARLVDHARQGESGDPRGRHPGRRAGDRQRRGDRVRAARRATSSSTCSCR